MGLMDVKKSKMPDDMQLLHKLLDNDYLVKTPSQDYDDSYSIQYAKKFNAFMVTNDKFRDYIDAMHQNLHDQDHLQETQGGSKKNSPNKQKKSKKSVNPQDEQKYFDKSEIKREQVWIKSHSISYTFNKDEFLPNPDCKLWQQKFCVYNEYRNYPLDLL